MIRKSGFTEYDAETVLSGLPVSRRQFLKRLGILGGGMVICFSVGNPNALARMAREGFLGSRIPTDFNAFLKIGTDERVTCLTGKIEMGQGPITSLPQMLAEELDVSLDAVDIVMGDTDLCPWDAGTFGSLTTRHFGVFLREAAAEARGVLKELAAARLKADPTELVTEKGAVFVKKLPENRVTYGQLTRGKIIEKHLDPIPDLKHHSSFTVMGKSLFRDDARVKVTGEAKYAGDIQLPGMLYARILRPPAHGAVLKHVDVTEAEKMKDVQVVRDNELTAVLHKYPDVAEQALYKIKARFSTNETGIDHDTIFAHLVKNAPSPVTTSKSGSIETGKAEAQTILEETYLNSYVAHAPIETHTATAQFEGDRVTVWSSTQRPFGDQEAIAAALKLPADRVRVITPFVGGGFGGKTTSHQAVEAARLAKITGRPIQVAWTREEEFFYDTYRPAAIVKITSGLNASGNAVLWDYHAYFGGKRGSEPNYNLPNHQVLCYGDWRGPGTDVHPFAVGPWRAPANNTNVYARELHMNLMAEAAKADPLAFRLKHLTDKRMIRVFKAAADIFQWTPAKVPSGRGFGIACGVDAGTYVVSMAEVEVDKSTGAVKVKRVVCAQDMGFVVNPQGATIQIEGCITMGLGYALSEGLRFRNGRILDTNFDTYPLPRFSWVPEIQTVIVDNPDLPPQGGGEPAIINMGGVIATAIHDAVGIGVFQLPMTPQRVKSALG